MIGQTSPSPVQTRARKPSPPVNHAAAAGEPIWDKKTYAKMSPPAEKMNFAMNSPRNILNRDRSPVLILTSQASFHPFHALFSR